MKTVFLSFLLWVSLAEWNTIHAVDLNYLRKSLEASVRDENLCKGLIKKLSEKKDSPVHTAYLGAFQTIWANHVSHPLSKLKTFHKGKKNIEDAVKADAQSIEIRSIRLCIQENSPAFLGYKQNITEDRAFVLLHIQQIESPDLLSLIQKILG